MNVRWVISCEHGGNEIPAAYAPAFAGAEELLSTHRGWDPGALNLFKLLQPLADFSLSSTTSRLLVELNRSLHHPALFSQHSQQLSNPVKEQVLEQYYFPYRQQVEEAVAGFIGQGSMVIHLSIHSFTPVLNGEIRNADVGLLYDPGRESEKSFCSQWKEALKKELPDKRVRFNYPYKGTADGFTTYLRKKYPQAYAGIEFELNQKWADQEQIHQKIHNSLLSFKKTIG